MKFILFVVLALPISLIARGQNVSDEQLVRKVVLSFQNDFNEGSFKNALHYTTDDWEHLNPLGGITTKGRAEERE